MVNISYSLAVRHDNAIKHFLIYYISAKTIPPSAYTNVSGTLFIKYFSLFLLQYKQVFVRRQRVS